MNTTNGKDIMQVVDDIYKERFKPIVERPEPVYETLDILESTLHVSSTMEPSNEDIWIFGYGSLVWKADFPFIERKNGFINGFLRRFYQHSTDHRGNAKKPGRVVTLISASLKDRVYGVAYRISAAEKDDVLKHLDYREKNGYQRCTTEFHEYSPEGTSSGYTVLDIIVYIATSENASWAGDKESIKIRNIVKQIVTSRGQSGTNRQYLFNLAKSLEILFPGIVDDHIQELLTAVFNFIKIEEPIWLEQVLKKQILCILKRNHNSHENTYLNGIVKSLLGVLRNSCTVLGWREVLYMDIPLGAI